MNIQTNYTNKLNNNSLSFSANKSEQTNINDLRKEFKSEINRNAYYGKDLVKTSNTKSEIPEDLKILFEDLKGKEGKEFAEVAYKGLIKHYKLEGVVPDKLYWDKTCKGSNLDIVSDYRWYENNVVLYEDLFLNSGKTKEEQFGFIAHEVTHMKQLVNIMQTEDLPLTTVATAFAIFDFNSTLSRNPVAQQQFRQAKQNGKEKEYTRFMLGNLARKNYGELSTSFKDALNSPKHPLSSPNGQKALRDLDSWSKYNSHDWNTYSGILVEKEAFDEENKMRAIYRNYMNKKKR